MPINLAASILCSLLKLIPFMHVSSFAENKKKVNLLLGFGKMSHQSYFLFEIDIH